MARGEDARVAGVMYLARGGRRPRCGRNVFGEGEDARVAGVMYLARGMDICQRQM